MYTAGSRSSEGMPTAPAPLALAGLHSTAALFLLVLACEPADWNPVGQLARPAAVRMYRHKGVAGRLEHRAADVAVSPMSAACHSSLLAASWRRKASC